MVQKSIRFHFLVILFLILLGCKTENTIIGKVNNKNSNFHYWNYIIGYKTYNSNRDELREGIVDPFALKFFKVRLVGDESYIMFFLKSVSKKSSRNQYDLPVYLYMDNYLVNVENNDEILDIYMTSPIELKIIEGSEKHLEIVKKKDVDYYLIYVSEVDSDSLAFSFITDGNPNDIDLKQFLETTKVTDIESYLKSDESTALINMFESLKKSKKYYVYGIGFIRNSFGDVVQFTAQPITPYIF